MKRSHRMLLLLKPTDYSHSCWKLFFVTENETYRWAKVHADVDSRRLCIVYNWCACVADRRNKWNRPTGRREVQRNDAARQRVDRLIVLRATITWINELVTLTSNDYRRRWPGRHRLRCRCLWSFTNEIVWLSVELNQHTVLRVTWRLQYRYVWSLSRRFVNPLYTEITEYTDSVRGLCSRATVRIGGVSEPNNMYLLTSLTWSRLFHGANLLLICC